jgi:NADH dehydrogenase (ubiquinone) Fe-S protein 5
MASGFALKGGRPRCFAFWQDVQECFLTADNPVQECVPYKDDYLECLHHPKEVRFFN